MSHKYNVCHPQIVQKQPCPNFGLSKSCLVPLKLLHLFYYNAGRYLNRILGFDDCSQIIEKLIKVSSIC